MLLHQLRQDLVLLAKLGFHGRNLAGLGVLLPRGALPGPVKSGRPVLEEFLLPTVNEGGVYRTRLWEVELQAFADETGLEVTVCHLPPGTSKWNKIEHRLFSHVSMNWRGKPLVSHEVVVNLIASTKTRKGLKVKARLDKKLYPTKIKVSNEELDQVNLQPHDFHGEWNYTIGLS